MDTELREQIVETLDKIRPYIQRDGGDVEFVDIDADGVVYVRMMGACVGCFAADDTIKLGVEAILMDEIPFVKEVRVVED
jgi:Fe-S cluster biogenesis protein NfuA